MVVQKAVKADFDCYPSAKHMGVIRFRQAMKGIEITGMIPPYGSNKRTDEDEFYGELKAA